MIASDQPARTKLLIDPERCQGHLRCQAKAPELFDSDEQGFGVVLDPSLADPNHLAAARAAVNACPEGAIRLEDSP